MQRADTYSVRVSVDGTDLGVFDKMNGGDVDSEETTYTPGGLADQISLGGRRSTGNVTVSKLYDGPIHGLYHWLVTRVGRADVVVTKQPLTPEGQAFARPVVYSGKLKSVKSPDVDSSSNSAALLELDVTVNGIPA